MIYQASVAVLLALFCLFVLRNLRDYAVCGAPAVPLPPQRLSILVPARNEQENIEECLRGILAQELSGLSVLVLDDGSTDGTGAIVDRLAALDSRLQRLAGAPLPPGRAGKVWACEQLAAAAIERGAEWILFLDADTRSRPQLAAALLSHAQETGAAMVSTFPYQVTGTFSERVTLPMLQFLITTFLPVRMVWESPQPAIAAACGQVELFRVSDYLACGGHAAIPGSFHDGLQLARRVKRAGGTVRLPDCSALVCCRMYRGAAEVWNGFTRNAYEGLGSFGALVVMTLVQCTLFLGPFVSLLTAALLRRGGHWPAWTGLCIAQAACILLIRTAQARRFGHLSAIPLHPLSIAALTAIQWASFWKAKTGAVSSWKGRTYGPGGEG